MSFPLFNAFPAEIHSMILESCHPTDRVCLRLTCKYLYALSPTPKNPISLEETPLKSLCNSEDATRDWSARYKHRQECHKLSYETTKARYALTGRKMGPMKPKCHTMWGEDHCQCYIKRTKLHFRLKGWMQSGSGKKRNYCGRCEKFTVRKKGHSRCYHGHPKPRSRPTFNWSNGLRRRYWSRREWKKGYTNRAMNRLEARLRTAIPEEKRKGSARYSLRSLPGTGVDTKVDRNNFARKDYYY